MKTKLFIIVASAIALFSFSAVKVEKAPKKEIKAVSTAKPAAGLAIEDRGQWN
jgi:hypothetical protein